MSQALTKKKFVPGSLRGPRTPRTLLLRMAADDARAARIRETWVTRKAENPKKYTWAKIAEHVGTTERAAQEWQRTGGIDYDNARKLAKYFSVDFDWLWRGPKDEAAATPDPFDSDDRLDEIKAQVIENGRLLNAILIQLTGHDPATMSPSPPPDDEHNPGTSSPTDATAATPAAHPQGTPGSEPKPGS